MTAENQSTTGAEPENSTRNEPRWRRSTVVILVIALVAGLAGAFASNAMSHGFGFGFGPGRWHHGGFMSGEMDSGAIEERVDRALRHLAIEIDATPEQQEKLRAIINTAVNDLLPMRDTARAGRQQARELLTRPTVDRAAIETFRAEHMAHWDAATRRIAQALADAAEVLTPEQRGKIDELLPSGGYWHGWRRG
jgi:Spy/CpxP family protein refolding chaperone